MRARASICAGWARSTRHCGWGRSRYCWRRRRWTSALAPAVIFTDVCYTAYLNSFYMDAAALSGLLLMTACAVWIASGERTSTRPGDSLRMRRRCCS